MHQLRNLDKTARTAECSKCGPVRVHNKGNNQFRCSQKSMGAKRYKRERGDVCERCGFVPEDMCQLDADHIDGNHSNDDPSNLQTLCANCHRLKTKRERAGEW